MRAPVEIREEGRIHITTCKFKDDMLEEEIHCYKANFSFFARGEKNRRWLVIYTDKTFTRVLGFSLDHGPMKSDGFFPEWLHMALETFNKGGLYDEAVERALKLITLNSEEYCYQLITRRETRRNIFLSNGPRFKDNVLEEKVRPEKTQSNYRISRFFKPGEPEVVSYLDVIDSLPHAF